MPDDTRTRGAKALSDRDWIFGSRPRRRLLEGVLLGSAPNDGWSRPSLAALAGVVANGGVDEHIKGLERLQLLLPAEPGRWLPADRSAKLPRALRRVLGELGSLSDTTAKSASVADRRAAALRAIRAAERAVSLAASELGVETAAECAKLLSEIHSRAAAGP